MPQATVAASMIRALLAYLAEVGLDADRLAYQAGIGERDLVHPERPIDAQQFEALMQAAIAASHNPLLGLEFGMAARPERWGTLGLRLRHCARLGEALAYQARFAHLVNSVGRGHLVEYPEYAAIEWKSAHAVMPALIEEAFAAWVCFARWSTARHASPIVVELGHRAQGDPAVYTAFFRCPVRFQAKASRLCFDPGLRAEPLHTPDAQLTATLSQRVAARQKALDTCDVVTRLQTWLATELAHGVPDLARAAHSLALNERTLQHRLQSSGTRFRNVIDDARRALAERYLGTTQLSIGDISLRLGFSEQSAFQRAFRRWHATTPLAWRRSLANRC